MLLPPLTPTLTMLLPPLTLTLTLTMLLPLTG